MAKTPLLKEGWGRGIFHIGKSEVRAQTPSSPADIHPLTLKKAAEHHKGLWLHRKFLFCGHPNVGAPNNLEVN